ncbi:MAG: type II toxin-antitoxin system RelE/ParE family toxin [Lactobacillus sp.]|jgi:phage-related protein|nr:type II toxin-antitoxin system RelE/ParE family toxin [Lactobacillus sp.]
MNKLEFETYRRPNGHDEFLEWIETLPTKDSAKMLRVINETEENGMLIAQRLRWVRKLDTNLYELRSKVGSNIQRAIYFHVEGERYVITHGFTKKGDKTPPGQIRHGKALRKEWLDNEN